MENTLLCPELAISIGIILYSQKCWRENKKIVFGEKQGRKYKMHYVEKF